MRRDPALKMSAEADQNPAPGLAGESCIMAAPEAPAQGKEVRRVFHLITGGSGSGKSAYAENLVLAAGEGTRIYVATMIPYGEEARQRVERHRRLRAEKNFHTVECYTGLSRLSFPRDGIVLLECMSNLAANEMFEENGAHEGTREAVLSGISHVLAQVKHLFVVTNEVFSDGITYDKETARYLAYLGEINCRLAREADEVTEVVFGIPVKLKKCGSDLLLTQRGSGAGHGEEEYK